MPNLLVTQTPNNYELLFPNHAKFFIGGISTKPGQTGQFIPHLTDNLSKLDFINFLTSTFGSEGITKDDLIEFRLDVEDMFKYHTNFISNMIRDSNNELFNRMVQFNTDGTFRAFHVLYSRLVSGIGLDQSTINSMIVRLSGLYAHFLKELQVFPLFNEDGSPVMNYDSWAGKRINPVYKTAENFYMLIDVLLMHMACEYFGNKEFFSTETVIEDSIKTIRSILFNLINSPKNNHTNRKKSTGSNPAALSNVYMLNVLLKHPKQYAKIQLILGGTISGTDIGEMLNTFTHEINYNEDDLRFNIKISNAQHEFFDTVLNLMGRLHHVEQMYLALKQKAGSSTTEPNEDVGAQFKLMFNAPVAESSPSTEVLQG